jgi:hypothetical protein
MKPKILEPIFYNFNSSSGIEEGMSTFLNSSMMTIII